MYYNHVDTLQALLAAGADTAVRYGPLALTPLLAAATYDRPDCAAALLAAGADPAAVCSQGKTAAQRAADSSSHTAAVLGARPEPSV